MVNDWQQSTLNASKASMQGVFDETMGGISNRMADQGILDSSAYGNAAGMAQRDLMRQYGTMAAQTQAQAAQQLMGFSGQNQQVGMNLLGLQNQTRQWASNPQLLRDLMQYRVQTGRMNAGGTATTDRSTNSSQTTKEQTPTDWFGALAGIGGLIGTGGLSAMLGLGGAAAVPRSVTNVDWAQNMNMPAPGYYV
jgi:hypothetical protein